MSLPEILHESSNTWTKMLAKPIEKQNHNAFFSQRAAWLFTGKVIPVIMLFYITILYSRRLSYEDYGRFQSAWMYINILNIIISFGAPSLILSSDLSFLRSFVRKHKNYLAWFFLGLTAASFGIFMLTTQVLSVSTKLLLIIFTVVQTISVVRETILLKVGKSKAVFAVNFLYSLCFLAWHYYVLYEGFRLDRLITGVIVIAIGKVLLFYLIRHGQTLKTIEIPSNKEFQKHWLFFGLNDVLGVVSKWIDKVFLVYLLTPADFALYFNGSFEIPLFGLLVSTIGMIAILEIASSIGDQQKIVKVFHQSFVLLSNIVFPLFFFLLFFNKELFSVVFSDRYNLSLPIFIISICILPVRINNYTVILQCYEKGNKIIAGSILDISLAFALMLVTYPFLGTKGIALAVVLATYAQALYYLFQSARVLRTTMASLVPYKDLLLRFFFAGVFYFLLFVATQNLNPLLRLVIVSVATILIIMIAVAIVISKKNIRFA